MLGEEDRRLKECYPLDLGPWLGFHSSCQLVPALHSLSSFPATRHISVVAILNTPPLPRLNRSSTSTYILDAAPLHLRTAVHLLSPNSLQDSVSTFSSRSRHVVLLATLHFISISVVTLASLCCKHTN